VKETKQKENNKELYVTTQDVYEVQTPSDGEMKQWSVFNLVGSSTFVNLVCLGSTVITFCSSSLTR